MTTTTTQETVATPTATRTTCRAAAPSGFTLTELMVVVTILVVMTAMSAPSFQLAVEQSRADIAAANLRAIWAAERLYWLENQTYTDNLSQLINLGLLDPKLPTAEPTVPIPDGRYWDLYYWYSVTLGADATQSFTAYVKAAQYTGCTSTLTIDASGKLDGQVTPSGSTKPITPIDFW